MLQVGPSLVDDSPWQLDTDHRWVWRRLCFRYMQAIPADTVIAYITHDDRPNI